MQQSTYYVSQDGQQSGPYDLKQIVEKVNSGSLAVTDYLYDEAVQDWVILMECQELIDMLKGQKPKKAPSKTTSHEPEEEVAAFGEKTVVAQKKSTPQKGDAEEWYVLKWDNRYGPFTYVDLVKMLQDKSVFEFDYVWKPGFESWKRVAEVESFQTPAIKKLKETKLPELSEVFFRRRHVRTKFNGSIIVHDSMNVWKGESLEISEGGAGIVMHNALVLPGQKIFLHFKPGDGVPPFNAVCEVVSKQYVKGIKQKDAPVGYGIKFLEIKTDVQQAIRKYANKTAA